MAANDEDRPRSLMWCSECHQEDDHPRHHVMFPDGTKQTLHMDCCRDSGLCLDAHCDTILTESGEKRYYELLEWIKENK
jgi:hypothetical protein